MNILALEPYYGGSHKAFLDGWTKSSRHDWTLLTLPAYKWKWRMRHSAATFAEQTKELIANNKKPDVIFCSDMLNLAEFLGLAGPETAAIPSVVYFHENQLTYPVQCEDERDYQFAMTNLTTAVAAGCAWFNTAFHRDSFLDAMSAFLKKMPDYQPVETIEQIKNKSLIAQPGIEDFPARTDRKPGPLRILYCARWEHDKNPEDFFEALKFVKEKNVKFTVDVIGEQFRDSPRVFDWAKDFFKDNINRWGYQENYQAYKNALLEADVVVSTANHEFFGISIVEAIAAGAYPVLPQRLAYPEILKLNEQPENKVFFYNGTVKQLAEKLRKFADRVNEKGGLWKTGEQKLSRLVDQFKWPVLAKQLDDNLEQSAMV